MQGEQNVKVHCERKGGEKTTERRLNSAVKRREDATPPSERGGGGKKRGGIKKGGEGVHEAHLTSNSIGGEEYVICHLTVPEGKWGKAVGGGGKGQGATEKPGPLG